MAHLNYKRSRKLSDYQHFSELRAQCKTQSDSFHENFIVKSENSSIANPKHFWNFINSVKKISNLPNHVFLENHHADTSEGIAELFSRYLMAVYGPPVSSDTQFVSKNSIEFSYVYISKDDIFCILYKLDSNKGADPDGIHPSLIRSCCSSLIHPLYLIFDKSITEGFFPGEWKRGIVSPIYKSGNRHDIRNYRLITLLSFIPEIFESII